MDKNNMHKSTAPLPPPSREVARAPSLPGGGAGAPPFHVDGLAESEAPTSGTTDRANLPPHAPAAASLGLLLCWLLLPCSAVRFSLQINFGNGGRQSSSDGAQIGHSEALSYGHRGRFGCREGRFGAGVDQFEQEGGRFGCYQVNLVPLLVDSRKKEVDLVPVLVDSRKEGIDSAAMGVDLVLQEFH
jgi:hypothetical protein